MNGSMEDRHWCTRLEDDIHCQTLTMAAIESARSGEAIDLRQFEARHLGHVGLEEAPR